jgi:ribosome-associated heat shock protein Hsp15
VPVTEVRVDRWLWAARLFKTRGAATEAVLGGRVHVNGVRVKPAKGVRAGDRLEVTVARARRELVVLDVAEKRGPAAVAATLYEETPESVVRREELALERRQSRPLGADLGARPTKRDRRRLDALRRAQQRRGQPPR